MLIATISTQRSGTKLLSRCFSSGTAVSPFGEIFNPDSDQIGSFRRFMAIRGEALLPHGLDYILDAYFAEFSHVRDIISFDVMFNQLTIPVMTWNTHGFRGFYGYLQSRKAIIIRLHRNALDSYVSMIALSHTGHAHRTSNNDAPPHIDPFHINLNDFQIYLQELCWYRQNAQEAMTGYNYDYCLNYDTIKDTNQIPEDLKGMIEERARLSGLFIDREHIQMHNPRIVPTGIDYTQIVANYNELHDIFQRFPELG